MFFLMKFQMSKYVRYNLFSEKDICTKRPGTGILSIDYKEVIGKKVKNKILENKIIKLEDLND